MVMPNNRELDWEMSVTADGHGIKVDRKGRSTKIPWFLMAIKLLVAVATPGPEGKMGKKMRADLESSG